MPEYVVRATNLPKDPFVRGYLECAEFADWPPSNEAGTRVDRADEATWSKASLLSAAEDCAAFQADNAEQLINVDPARAGHDFWLTRNRHGAGFWDGDYPEPAAHLLTEAAHAWGSVYVDFDPATGMLHLS